MRRLLSFRCTQCGYKLSEYEDCGIGDYAMFACPLCDGRMQRCASFTFTRSSFNFETHLNPTTGTVVNSKNRFIDDLHRKSDEISERTGVAHDYQPVDMNDKEALGVTDEGLDATERRAREEGRTERKSLIL